MSFSGPFWLASPFSLTSRYGVLLVPIQIDIQEDPQTDYSRTARRDGEDDGVEPVLVQVVGSERGAIDVVVVWREMEME